MTSTFSTILFFLMTSVSIIGYAQQKDKSDTTTTTSKKGIEAKINHFNTLIENAQKNTNRQAIEHIIKPKETWYRISKRYGISITKLKKTNPDIAEKGLQPGMTLKIPTDPLKKQTAHHIVQAKETWYGLSKNYSISIDDLQAVNPIAVKEGLKTGARLNIPLPDPNTPKTEPHILKEKETWYSLSKNYSISIDDLQAVNPIAVKEGLKTGARLNIPLPDPNTPKTEPHILKEKETWYSLSKNYSISIDDLQTVNPIAVKEGLKTGTTIKIPIDKKKERKNPINTNINDKTIHRISRDLAYQKRISKLDKNDTLWMKLPVWKQQQKHEQETLLKKPLNIDIFLPFGKYAHENTSANELFKEEKKLTNLVLDFYLGASLALNTLQKRGVDLRYRTFDTANHSDTITKIFQQNDFSKSNAIIGPLYSNHLQQIVDMSHKETRIIYPTYSHKQIGFKGKRIIKTSPDIYYYEKAIKDYISKNLNGRKLVIIGDKTEKSRINNLSLQDFFKRDTMAEIEIINAEEDYLDASIFKPIVSDSIHNRNQWILVNTDNAVITSDIINNIKGIYKHTNNIRLFSFTKGENFEKIDEQMLGRLNFTYATNTITEENDEADKYRVAFYKNYGAYPTKYAIMGFDVVYDIVTRMLLPERTTGFFGKFFSGAFGTESNQFDQISNGEITTKRISHYYKYKRGVFQTLDNQAIYLIRYDTDLNLEIRKELQQ